MGTSNWQNISYCVGILRRLRPESVLDIGTGFGRWGVLAREFLDVWEGREARALWQTRIEGIEAFPACLTPLHGYIYDRLHVGDAVDLLPTLGTFDVIYMGDVVEHQTRSRAYALVDEAVRHARQAAIVTIPIGDNWPQEMGWDGNTYHAHRSVWHLEDFDRYAGATRRTFSDYRGRMFLVAELPGEASGGSPGACRRESASSRKEHELPGELAARIDENLFCRGLSDNPDLGLDLSGALLHQLPASIALQRTLADLEAEGLSWVPPLTAMVDSLFRHFVAIEAARPPDERGLAAPPHAVETIERLAAAVSSLAAHAATSPAAMASRD